MELKTDMHNEDQKPSEGTWLPDIRMSAEHLSALVKSSPLGMLAFDLEGKIVLWNQTLEKISGWWEGEMLGRSIEVIAPEHGEDYEELRRRTLQREVFNSLPMSARNKNGTSVLLSYSTAPIVDPDGCIVGTMAVVYDITEKMRLETALRESLAKMARAVDETVSALAAAIERRDPYTAGHQRRVGELACAIAGAIGGMDDDRIKGLRTAAIIHDIGKLHVPLEILTRPGQPTALEFELIKTHAQAGYEILQGIEFPWPVARIVRQHHERMDGGGYPSGLIGNEILLEARILAVADTVEAMSLHRPYRPGMGIASALQEIGTGRGRGFDPDAVDACLELFRGGFTWLV